MRIYISADMEGIAGISKWDETIKGRQDYERYREQMTREVAAACEAAIEAGADTILVKDAHEDGKNLLHELLPRTVKVISGWSNHPYCMVEGLDESFDAAIFIGYHCGSSSNGSTLSHTLYPDRIRKIIINGEDADEFLIHAYVCRMLGVPIAAVSGDGELMRHVKGFDEDIKTIALQEGFGGAMVSIHPDLAIERIRRGVKKALTEGELKKETQLPEQFEMTIEFKKHEDAYKYAFYPKAEQIGEYTIRYASDQYMDLLTFMLFL
ncbi:MAG: amino acid amidase [Cellulosilyticum sp.]|nr:amino acid amidase [Cellulosilyticum sp.]